jgi:hypothetical protein
VNRRLFSLRARAATAILALALSVLPRGAPASRNLKLVQIDKIVALFAIDRVGRNRDGTARESSTLYRFDPITRFTPPIDETDWWVANPKTVQSATTRGHAPGRESRPSKMFQAS